MDTTNFQMDVRAGAKLLNYPVRCAVLSYATRSEINLSQLIRPTFRFECSKRFFVKLGGVVRDAPGWYNFIIAFSNHLAE